MRRRASILVLALLATPMQAEETPPPDGHIESSECPKWVESTYRIEELIAELELDLAEDYATVSACVRHDAGRMQPVIPIGWCDNVLKIHCSALDLLAEIADAQASRCEGLLADSLGLEVRRHRSWQSCGRDAVFDRYALHGQVSDEAACRDALLGRCGASLDAAAASEALTDDQRRFVECCSAAALDPERCATIDPGFARGPCRFLDEDGVLSLATATPEELIVHSRARVLEPVSWTVPTLVGSTLYLRDQRRVVALDLGRSASPEASPSATDFRDGSVLE